MALPTYNDAKLYLKEQTNANQALITRELVGAFGQVQAYLRVPILAEERTFVLEKPSDSVYRTVTRLHVPAYPIAADSSNTPGLEITDEEGTVLVEGTDYRLDLRTGTIYGIHDSAETPFGNWPYTITCFVGLDARADYATAVEPILFSAILDVVADRMQRRSPAATSETTGGGVSTSYANEHGLPSRVCFALDPFRMVRAL
jgi:hypothetical protein